MQGAWIKMGFINSLFFARNFGSLPVFDRGDHGMVTWKNEEYPSALRVFFKIGATKWKGCILCCLSEEPLRFSSLQQKVGCSHKVLAEKLREMEDDGLLVKNVMNTMPLQVWYEITQMGLEMLELHEKARHWVAAWAPQIGLKCTAPCEQCQKQGGCNACHLCSGLEIVKHNTWLLISMGAVSANRLLGLGLFLPSAWDKEVMVLQDQTRFIVLSITPSFDYK